MKKYKLLSKVWVTKPVKLHFSNESSSGYTEIPVGTSLTIVRNNEMSYTVAYSIKRKHWDTNEKYRIVETARLLKTDSNCISLLASASDVDNLLNVKRSVKKSK